MNESLQKDDEPASLLKKVPPAVWIGLAVAITLDTAVQLCWRRAAQIAESHVSNPSAVDTIIATVHEPLTWLVVILFSLQLANWYKVLEKADLSFSQPITSLSYISVCILSAIFLGEHITVLQIVGVLFILAGVWFISRTEHSTVVGKDQT